MRNVKTRKWLIALQLVALVGIFPGASMAQAGTTTNLQFIINPFTGGLSINVPTSESFPTIESPDTLTVVTTTLETVTVTDTRRTTLIRSWTTNAVVSDLLTGSDSLTAGTIGYSSGPSTAVSGLVGVTEYTRSSLNVAIMVENGATVSGNHAVSWTPTLSIPVPYNKPPGTYIGVLTHSVF